VRSIRDCGVELKTREEIRCIGRSTAAAVSSIRAASRALRPGSLLDEAVARAERCAAARGAHEVRVFTSLNSTAAHGLPGGAVLRDGDLVTVDVSVCLDGWFGDAAWTFIVGSGDLTTRRLVAAAWNAVWFATRAARGGVAVGEIARGVRETAGRFRCAVAEQCVGHGIGRALHEEPAMAYVDPGVDGFLVPGMVFTVEPVLTAGGAELREHPGDGGLVTADGSLAAQFELTVAVRATGPTLLGLTARAGRR
jgi:methionyl aminopeptidase